MTRASDWLNGYIKAWETKDGADVRAIFTDDAEYWFRPNDPTPEAGIDAIVFDRGGYLYHGRVKAVAEGARASGLTF